MGCGYGGAYLANQEAGKVVIQSAAPAETEGAGDSGDTAAKAQNTAETNGALSGTERWRRRSARRWYLLRQSRWKWAQFWFGPQVVSGAGSGVIISEDGYILTCAHVVSGADTITVILPDGTEYPGTVTGMYEEGDIAVVKIEATGPSGGGDRRQRSGSAGRNRLRGGQSGRNLKRNHHRWNHQFG